MTDSRWTPEVAAAIRASLQWHLISLLFQPPTAAWRTRLADLAGQADDAQLADAVQAALRTSSETLYYTTLGPGGPAAPREVSYRRALQPGQFLGQLAELYAAFAYHPNLQEAPDHVAVESGFVSYLLFKAAYARMSGETDHAEVCCQAACRFLENHLANTAEPLAAALEHSGIDYLAGAARALLQRTGPAPKRAMDTEGLLEIVNDDECAAACP